MGTYVYGIYQKHITIDDKNIHFCKYIYKPSWNMLSETPRRIKSTITRLKNQWEDKQLPKYIVVCHDNKISNGSIVYNFHDRKTAKGHVIYPSPIFSDNNEFGSHVGELVKNGEKW